MVVFAVIGLASFAVTRMDRRIRFGALVRGDVDLKTGTPQEEPRRHFIYVLDGSGFGSQIMNAVGQAVYFQETQGRSMIVDESFYPYGRRFNDSRGLLSLYFTPQFPVIGSFSEFETMVEQLRPGTNYTGEREHIHWTERNVIEEAMDVSNASETLYVTGLWSLRDEIMEYYNLVLANKQTILPVWMTGSKAFYEKMSDYMCPHFQFNEQTLEEIERHKIDNGVPVSLNGTSVAFHIRRGDKIRAKTFSGGKIRSFKDLFMWIHSSVRPRGESRLFPADAYIKRFLKEAPRGAVVDHCFVSSDDYRAVEEMKKALKHRNVHCQVHSITTETEQGHGLGKNSRFMGDEALHFLSELSAMIGATYFVGTFNSNVGLFVAAMRGCNATDRRHFAHSYGVDREYFYLK